MADFLHQEVNSLPYIPELEDNLVFLLLVSERCISLFFMIIVLWNSFMVPHGRVLDLVSSLSCRFPVFVDHCTYKSCRETRLQVEQWDLFLSQGCIIDTRHAYRKYRGFKVTNNNIFTLTHPSERLLLIIFRFIYLFIYCVRGSRTKTHMWKWQKNPRESIFSSIVWVLGNQTQIIRFDGGISLPAEPSYKFQFLT